VAKAKATAKTTVIELIVTAAAARSAGVDDGDTHTACLVHLR
jgi:hypothetical protein